jgi:EAL domain-containing protein (putative c-di-GMP-specific phosphodiesterase class I)
VQSAFYKPVNIGELKLHVILTAGAVMIFSGYEDRCISDEILRHADLALADAKTKTAGHAQIYHADLSAHVQLETELGQALRQASEVGLFDVHYQAQFDCNQSRISGFEALARWSHPTRGNISPAIFIPLAERLGIINKIGDFVMSESLRQMTAWRKSGAPERTISVNVSPAQLLQAGFVERVRALLNQYSFPARLLCLELTESIFLGDQYAETLVVLHELRKLGVVLALDDFGTGYSSLGYLSKLPFQIIKVDRSFVTKVDDSERRAGILKSIIVMGHTLGMTIVAEGAETPQELALLLQLSVEKVQGYVIARPTAAPQAFARAAEIDSRYQPVAVAQSA